MYKPCNGRMPLDKQPCATQPSLYATIKVGQIASRELIDQNGLSTIHGVRDEIGVTKRIRDRSTMEMFRLLEGLLLTGNTDHNRNNRFQQCIELYLEATGPVKLRRVAKGRFRGDRSFSTVSNVQESFLLAARRT